MFSQHEYYTGVSGYELGFLLREIKARLKAKGDPERLFDGEDLRQQASVNRQTITRLMQNDETLTFVSLDVADRMIVACNHLGYLDGHVDEFLTVFPGHRALMANRMAEDEWCAHFGDDSEPHEDWVEMRAAQLVDLRERVLSQAAYDRESRLLTAVAA